MEFSSKSIGCMKETEEGQLLCWNAKYFDFVVKTIMGSIEVLNTNRFLPATSMDHETYRILEEVRLDFKPSAGFPPGERYMILRPKQIFFRQSIIRK